MPIRLLKVTARIICSSVTPSFLATATTGMVQAMPWLPEPELDTTGASAPAMRASAPAEAICIA